MRRILILALIASSTFSLPFATAVEAPVLVTPTGAISTSGTARILVAPDEVVVSLAAEAFEKDLALAKSSTDAGIAATLAAARGLGIPEERIQTDAIDIGVSWHTPGNLPAFGAEDRYFKVRRAITVILGDPALLDPLLSKALAGGITTVDGISFRSTRLREHRDAARLQAATAAREKAVALAGALGASVGRPTGIAERDNRWSWGGFAWNRSGGYALQNAQVQIDGGGNASADGSVAPGRIAVDATVEATFVLLAP